MQIRGVSGTFIATSELDSLFEFMEPEPNSACWLWLGFTDDLGYGRLRTTTAHRAAYRLLIAPIPKGLHVLHRCDTRCCINPAHLFLGTHQDNMRDMAEKGRASKRTGWNSYHFELRAAPACKRGHKFNTENSYWFQGRRRCKECRRESVRRWRRIN